MEKEKLRLLQRRELELLKELKRLCEAHGLRYWLTAGTLLGAVRHRGFIPWDDDIDVAMPRADFEELAEIGRKELAEGLFFQDHSSDPGYPLCCAKIRKDGTLAQEPGFAGARMHQGVYIDIFPLDVCPAGRRTAAYFFKLHEVLDCAARRKASSAFVCGYTRWYMRLLFGIARRFPMRMLFSLRSGLVKLAKALCSPARLCTVSGSHGCPRETYEAAWFEDTEEMEFEGERFPVPGGWRELLANMYGDYMTPPEETERGGHFSEIELKEEEAR